jgi:virginiamycin B lyase
MARSATPAQNGVSSSLVVRVPETTVAGDVLLAVVAVVHQPQVTAPAGWRLVRSDLVASGNLLTQAIYLHVASATEPPAYTWSFSAARGAVGGMVDYSGVDPVTPVTTTAAATTLNGLAITIPSVSATVANQELVAVVGVQGERTPRFASGLTAESASALGTVAGEKVSVATADQRRTSLGPTGAQTASVGLASTGIGQALLLNPAAAVPPPPKPTTIDTFPLPGGTRPQGIAAGPDGNVWFTGDTSVGRITPTGTVTLFAVPTTGGLGGIAAGPDGNLWFTEGGNYLDRITPAGTISRFPLPRPAGGISLGADGRLWLAESKASRIGRYDIGSHTLTEYPTPTANAWPHGIHLGPDGNIWFAETYASKIAKITTTGKITEYRTPTGGSSPRVIVAGPDGNLWFTEYAVDRVGRITPGGAISEFRLPHTGSHPDGITAARDGNLWFTEYDGNRVGRITTTGIVTENTITTPAAGPNKIIEGVDGNLWFTEQNADAVARLLLP